MIKRTIVASIIVGTFLLLASTAFAKTVSLAWDPSDDPTVTGYRLYYKINSSSLPYNGTGATEGASPIDVGNNLTATLNGLQEDAIVYFAVTAYNADGEESEFSNVVASEWIPETYTPNSGATVDPRQVAFSWGAAPTGSNITYTLIYGTDPQLETSDLARQSFEGTTLFASAAIFGLLAAALPARRKRQAAILLTLAGAIVLLVGCGGGGGGSDRAAAPAPIEDNSAATATVSGLSGTAYNAADLEANATYYWKVVAVDAEGQRRESETRSFTTGN